MKRLNNTILLVNNNLICKVRSSSTKVKTVICLTKTIGIWKSTLKTSLPLAALCGSLISNSPVFQAAWVFGKTLLLLQWMHELPTSEQSVASEKSCAVNCGWNIYLAVGKLEGVCAVCFTPVRFAIFPFVVFKRVLFAHPLTVTLSSPCVFLSFCFVMFFFSDSSVMVLAYTASLLPCLTFPSIL